MKWGWWHTPVISNPNTWEVKAGGSGVQAHPQYMRIYLKKYQEIKNKNGSGETNQ